VVQRRRATQPPPRIPGQTLRADDQLPDFTRLDDPAFLAERARVRDQLEHVPHNEADRADLEQLYEAMTLEFDRRASAAWAAASQHISAN
jgi:hypothetical protein